MQRGGVWGNGAVQLMEDINLIKQNSNYINMSYSYRRCALTCSVCVFHTN